MSWIGVIQLMLFIVVLIICIKPLGIYMACVYEGKASRFDFMFKHLENAIYRLCNINTKIEMDWKTYLISFLLFNFIGFFISYLLLRLQYYFPFNPQHFPNLDSHISFNAAVSYITNTNWQSYSSEKTVSYFSQLFVMTVQNFVSAAGGMSLLLALIRGLMRHETTALGNFWVDMTRSIVYILLPLSIIFSIFLVSQGVIQNVKSYQSVTLINPIMQSEKVIDHQLIPMGPVASQEAIKQLGSNGGGFFNANSAHPFENPTPLSNFFEAIAILLIPASLCYMFGVMIQDRKQGIAILCAMFFVFIPFVFCSTYVEQKGNPAFTAMHINQNAEMNMQAGGNMEGKETRFGMASSTFFATAATATSNGSNNAMYDSFTPMGGMLLLMMMHFGEVIFGGIGSGLYTMIMFVIMTVFIAGLLIGRSPEYLGKKIEPFEMKMASLTVLVVPLIVLISTAIAVSISSGANAIGNSGPHGFSEILYAFTSMGNNNGSAFAGLTSSNYFYTFLGGLTMLCSRYWIAISVLAMAGSLARKKIVPSGSGTLATHTPLFVFLLIYIIFIFGALSFLPALALGPIVEHLKMWSHYAH